ncbi:MAG: nucleotide exchange factor GrpE [Gemmatimonadota bacterium]|nr:nucleotide exchange factor GrpE [Gemmatimonadota bacterium]
MQRETPFQDPDDVQEQQSSDVPAAAQSSAADVEEIGVLEAERERYVRLAAEFDNFRKRTAKEAQQARSRGQGDLIKTLLDSLDDLSRFAHVDPATADCATLVHGVDLVERNMMKALAAAGVEVIDPIGLPFDPNLQEAVSTQPAESADEDHMVGQVYQRGYMLNGQLLRPARVVVKQYQ